MITPPDENYTQSIIVMIAPQEKFEAGLAYEQTGGPRIFPSRLLGSFEGIQTSDRWSSYKASAFSYAADITFKAVVGAAREIVNKTGLKEG